MRSFMSITRADHHKHTTTVNKTKIFGSAGHRTMSKRASSTLPTGAIIAIVLAILVVGGSFAAYIYSTKQRRKARMAAAGGGTETHISSQPRSKWKRSSYLQDQPTDASSTVTDVRVEERIPTAETHLSSIYHIKPEATYL